VQSHAAEWHSPGSGAARAAKALRRRTGRRDEWGQVGYGRKGWED